MQAVILFGSFYSRITASFTIQKWAVFSQFYQYFPNKIPKKNKTFLFAVFNLDNVIAPLAPLQAVGASKMSAEAELAHYQSYKFRNYATKFG